MFWCSQKIRSHTIGSYHTLKYVIKSHASKTIYHSNFWSEKLIEWTFSRGRKERGKDESAMRKIGRREKTQKFFEFWCGLEWDPCTLYILWRLKGKQIGMT